MKRGGPGRAYGDGRRLPQDDDLARLLELGETVHGIAARFGVQPDSVRRSLTRARARRSRRSPAA